MVTLVSSCLRTTVAAHLRLWPAMQKGSDFSRSWTALVGLSLCQVTAILGSVSGISFGLVGTSLMTNVVEHLFRCLWPLVSSPCLCCFFMLPLLYWHICILGNTYFIKVKVKLNALDKFIYAHVNITHIETGWFCHTEVFYATFH